MSVTVNSVALSSGQPSAPFRAVLINVDLDASYPAAGYDVSGSLEGGTVVAAEKRLHYDGAALRWLTVAVDGTVKAYANTNGAMGAEVAAATNLSGHTGVELWALVQ